MSIKPFKEYPELVSKLKERGMIIYSESYAERKLAQVGYYRLSGFWQSFKILFNADKKLSRSHCKAI